MRKTTQVLLRKEGLLKEVKITDEDKPVIQAAIEKKWQGIINLIATILNVPAGLIMRITKDNMEVHLTSDSNQNPYEIGGSDTLGHGLYCETVIGKDQELMIENALKLDEWRDNPDVKLNMISYLGLPVKWPDGAFYGTICVLDNKENIYSESYRELMRQFRDYIESDLELLIYQQKLRHLAEFDMLTCIYNRRKCDEILRTEYDRSRRNHDSFSVIILDLDDFKRINDTLGHDIGDKVLQVFSESLRNRIRSIDALGRWGGDEFILICPSTNKEGAKKLIDSISSQIISDMRTIADFADFSYGIAAYSDDDQSIIDVLRRADQAMYTHKQRKR